MRKFYGRWVQFFSILIRNERKNEFLRVWKIIQTILLGDMLLRVEVGGFTSKKNLIASAENVSIISLRAKGILLIDYLENCR